MKSSRSRPTRIVQVLVSLQHEDVIGDDCLAIHRTLMEAGYDAAIFAANIDPHIEGLGIPNLHLLENYVDDADIVLCHIAEKWDFLCKLDRLNGKKVFIWHGIIPPRAFEGYGAFESAAACKTGRRQMWQIHHVPSLCISSSSYGRRDLESLGYTCPILVIPPFSDFHEESEGDFDQELISHYTGDGFTNILSVGRLSPDKQQQDILSAFYQYHTYINPKSRLFLIGLEDEYSAYCTAIKEYPAAIGLDGVFFASSVNRRQKASYYRLADLFLYTGEHEGFCMPLLEAMHHRLPIIAYDSSPAAELLGGAGLPVKSKKASVLAEAIKRITQDEKLRSALIENGTERLADFSQDRVKSLLLTELSNFTRYWQRTKTIFFDITIQRKFDGGTGIQRLEKEEIKRLSQMEGEYKVVPFYFDKDGKGMFECTAGQAIHPLPGDILYSPDLSLDETIANERHLDSLHATGAVQIWFFIHDLIPIRFPETCSDTLTLAYKQWLRVVFRYTGIVGNSQSTINDVKAYLAENPSIERNPELRFGWVWSGCDFSSRFGTPSPAGRPPKDNEASPAPIAGHAGTVRLLMVSTVEPRKMYTQAVRAFILLRNKGLDIRLDIVGRKGWKVEETAMLIKGSPCYGESLFWHEGGISDEELDSLYRQADGVVVASKWEGFGLAVTEGAYYGKPLIIRDISVFREIAGDNAYYFSGYEPEDLARAIEDWLPLFKAGKAPSSAGIHLTTWQEHTDRLFEILTEA